MVDVSQTDCDIKLDTVLMGYRASKQASTKHSPFFMCFQREMRLPIDNEVLSSPQDDASPPDVEDEGDIDQVIEMLLCSREKSFKEVEVNIKLLK